MIEIQNIYCSPRNCSFKKGAIDDGEDYNTCHPIYHRVG